MSVHRQQKRGRTRLGGPNREKGETVRGLFEPEGEGTVTRAQYRERNGLCGRCGAPLAPEGPAEVMVCSSLRDFGWHRDRAE